MLPKIEHPIHEIYLKSLDRKVKFRPFLVKEEKILLIAKESKDPETIRTSIQQIIRNCLLEEDLDVATLPVFDIEMIFVKLRAKSVGESVKLVFKCNNEVDGNPCEAETDYTMDLEKVHYELPEGHDPKIMITPKLGIILKYPNLSNEIKLNEGDDEYTMLLNLLVGNIAQIFTDESVYKVEYVPQAELVEFLENLTVENMDAVQKFFSTSPKVVLDDTVKCKKCGFEHKLHTENLLDFFL